MSYLMLPNVGAMIGDVHGVGFLATDYIDVNVDRLVERPHYVSDTLCWQVTLFASIKGYV